MPSSFTLQGDGSFDACIKAIYHSVNTDSVGANTDYTIRLRMNETMYSRKYYLIYAILPVFTIIYPFRKARHNRTKMSVYEAVSRT